MPVKFTFVFPAGAFTAADSVTFCELPGVTGRLAGEIVTPEGNPLAVTVTDVLNPCILVIDTDTVAEPPALRLTLAGVTDKPKS